MARQTLNARSATPTPSRRGSHEASTPPARHQPLSVPPTPLQSAALGGSGGSFHFQGQQPELSFRDFQKQMGYKVVVQSL